MPTCLPASLPPATLSFGQSSGPCACVHLCRIKAISFSTEVKGKKLEMFAFIAVDDRRDTKECHVFMCPPTAKGQALLICKTLGQAFGLAVKEAKARAGNPFLPIGRIRERAEGPLAEHQFPRKDLRAIKAIGAGQFGRVFLALDESTDTNYAVGAGISLHVHVYLCVMEGLGGKGGGFLKNAKRCHTPMPMTRRDPLPVGRRA